MIALTVRITGDRELMARLNPARIAGPKRAFLARSVVTIQGNAREDAPVDRGRLRNSIVFQVNGDSAQVGSDLFYAPYVHEGTRPHFPPPAAVEGWARRHGFGAGGGFAVAQAIARNGTKPRPFLKTGFERSVPTITGPYLGALARDIEAALGG